MTEFNLEVKTPSGQNVLEFHEVSTHQLEENLSKIIRLLGNSDWHYLEFEFDEVDDE